MTVKEYRKKFDIDSNRMYSIALLYWPEVSKMPRQIKQKTMQNFLSIISKYEMPEIHDVNVLDEMVYLNKMVKNPECPNNVKSQFYVFKKRIIRELIDAGRIDKVTREGTVYLFSIDNGKYEFHQPLDYYKDYDLFNNLDIENGKQYVNRHEFVPLDIDRYKNWKTFVISHDADGIHGSQYFLNN